MEYLAPTIDLPFDGRVGRSVRVNGINLWAGPDNRPAGWPPDLRILGGDLAHPRSLVAAVSYDWSDDTTNWASTAAWPVLLQISIADVRDWRLATAARTWQPHDSELARVVDDAAWCRRQWQRLKEFAEVPSRCL